MDDVTHFQWFILSLAHGNKDFLLQALILSGTLSAVLHFAQLHSFGGDFLEFCACETSEFKWQWGKGDLKINFYFHFNLTWWFYLHVIPNSSLDSPVWISNISGFLRGPLKWKLQLAFTFKTVQSDLFKNHLSQSVMVWQSKCTTDKCFWSIWLVALLFL